MDDKINATLKYYFLKRKGILDFVNGNSDLTADEIIKYGEELAILEYKITGLQVAQEN